MFFLPQRIFPIERDGPWGTYGLGYFYINIQDSDKRLLTKNVFFSKTHLVKLDTIQFKSTSKKLTKRVKANVFNASARIVCKDGTVFFCYYYDVEENKKSFV